jgi:hypothetical protein
VFGCHSGLFTILAHIRASVKRWKIMNSKIKKLEIMQKNDDS